MLVLTRKQGERIKIGDDVVITVVRTKGKAVRLGIQAPSHVPVLRAEIAVSIAAENESRETAAEEAEADVEEGAGSTTSNRVQSLVMAGGRGPLHELVGARSV